MFYGILSISDVVVAIVRFAIVIGLVAAMPRGRHDKHTGWTKNRCIQWLFLGQFDKDREKAMAKIAGDTALEEYELDLQQEDVLDLRRRIDREASMVQWELKQLALNNGMLFLFTPPYVGKFLNPIEIVWAITKGRARRNIPISERKSDDHHQAHHQRRRPAMSEAGPHPRAA